MYLIVLFHAGVPWIRGSFIAVDLFFVLSGFLVTNVILSEVDAKGRLDLKRFYARRVRRLMPAAIVAVIGTAAIFVLVASVARRSEMIADAQAALLYFANWRYVLTANDYFAASADASPFLHYWTLSIEEQFYILFPLLVIVLLRFKRRWALPVGVAVLMLASVAAQVYWGRVDPIHAYYGTDARAYQLLAGVLLAVVWRHVAARELPRWMGTVSAVGGLVVFLALTPTSFVDVSQSMRGFIATVAIVAMIYGLMTAESQWLGRILSLRGVVYLGTITYATYLWHWPLVLVLDEVLEVRPELLALLVAIAATAMAALSNEVLEMPVRTAKWLSRHAVPVVVVGVSACVVAAIAVVPRILEADRSPALAVGSGPAGVAAPVAEAVTEDDDFAFEPIPDDIDWPAVRADTGRWTRCTSDEPEGCLVREGSGPHVLLVGDSHAAMLTVAFRDLADDHDLTLSVNVAGACPWQENLHEVDRKADLVELCSSFREGWYDAVLPVLQPDVVVLAARARKLDEWEGRLERRDGRPQDLFEALVDTSRETVEKIRGHGAEVVMVEEIVTPRGTQERDCLSRADSSAECAFLAPRERAATDAVMSTLAARTDGVHTVDLNPALCADYPVCAPVHDGRVVYADLMHVTATHASARRAEIWEAITATGAVRRARQGA